MVYLDTATEDEILSAKEVAGQPHVGSSAPALTPAEAQKKFKVPPEYVLKRSVGPDHAKTFEMDVQVQGEMLGAGAGKSKKEAEQAAARDALKRIKDI